LTSELAVSARGLVKYFGDRRVVDGVDIAVPKGLIYGVLGPNGAGKTTTLAHAARHHRARWRRALDARPRRIRATPATWSAISPRSAASIPT
jgi:ABC-type branched-subunit amino acid transport system ATPase component